MDLVVLIRNKHPYNDNPVALSVIYCLVLKFPDFCFKKLYNIQGPNIFLPCGY